MPRGSSNVEALKNREERTQQEAVMRQHGQTIIGSARGALLGWKVGNGIDARMHYAVLVTPFDIKYLFVCLGERGRGHVNQIRKIIAYRVKELKNKDYALYKYGPEDSIIDLDKVDPDSSTINDTDVLMVFQM